VQERGGAGGRDSGGRAKAEGFGDTSKDCMDFESRVWDCNGGDSEALRGLHLGHRQGNSKRRGNINFVPVLTKLSVDSAAADSFLAERFLSFCIGKEMPIKYFYSLNPAISNIG
jgi:hypothetical protein